MSVLSETTSNSHVTAVKFVIAGGFGVGKTTFVSAISEVEPLTTEAPMTVVASGVDDHSAIAGTAKLTTTVAMDFGRLTVDDSLVMYLFGAPGQARFTFMWDDLINGALGAVVLVDTRRVEDCFAAVDYFEKKGLPFVVGVNCFDGAAALPDLKRSATLWRSTRWCQCSTWTPGTVLRAATPCSSSSSCSSPACPPESVPRLPEAGGHRPAVALSRPSRGLARPFRGLARPYHCK